MKKKFIEWDMPLKEISEESAREKNIRHGHPSTLHIWWARRPLASSRATNFASLIDLPDNPEKREEIRELIKDITPWEAIKNGNSDAVKKARRLVLDQYDDPPKVLDPFAGGGSIPLEALRLGCNTYASDYNPVAVFIEKATVEWPQKYGINIEIPIEDAFERELKNAGYTKTQIKDIKNGTHQSLREDGTIEVDLLAHMVEKYANKVLEETKEEIGQFYPEKTSEKLIGTKETEYEDGWYPVGYIWARTIPCQNPNCEAKIPLIKQFWLAKKNNKKIAYRPIVDKENEKIDFKVLEGDELKEAIDKGFEPKEGTVSRANAECLVCSQVTKSKKLHKLGRNGKIDSKMIAAVYYHPASRGKQYRTINNQDKKIFSRAEEKLKEKLENWDEISSPIPAEAINEMNTREELYSTRCIKYGLAHWKDLYPPRQQLSLVTFMETIKDNKKEIVNSIKNMVKEKELHHIDSTDLANSIVGYLGVVFSRALDYGSSLSIWVPGGEFISHTFGRQTLPMTWDFFEVNLLNESTGGWKGAKDWVLHYLDYMEMDSKSSVFINKDSATDLPYDDNTFDAILTDPPYYDNINYAEISDFFYVWYKRLFSEDFKSLFSTPIVPKEKEIVVNPIRHKDREQSKKFFERMLLESFQENYRILKSEGVFLIIYAHKTTKGWETMLNGLKEAGFVITASWPVHTERTKWRSSASLASSIYMVCRKTEREELGFWKDIKPRIKEQVEEKLQQFWNKGIVGGDFFISAIGPGMEIYSKYENVERYSGEDVKTLDLLEYIRSITTDFVVNNLLKDASPTEVDSASQFYLAYRWTYLDNKVEFDDARRIASGMGIEVDEFSGKHGFVKQSRKYTSVLGPQDREEVEKIDNMVDVMHKCVLLWDEGKQDEIKRLLSETGYGQKPAFWQFCQAVAETLLNGNKEKQLLEGFLMGRDKYSKPSKESEQSGLDQYGGN